MNKQYLWLLVPAALGIAMSVTGCNLQDLIEVDVPTPVLQSVDLQGPISLREADAVWEDWSHYVETNSDRFREAVDDANARYTTLRQWTDIGMGFATEAAQGIPYGGIGLTMLTGLIGLALPQPKTLRKQKEG